MALASMSSEEEKMGDFMKQKWPCILTRNLDRNQVKNVIFVRKSSYDLVLTSFKQFGQLKLMVFQLLKNCLFYLLKFNK